ncbi:hypothetical protein TRIP_B250367 [uncultured Desulfatiglans sp.]|uniref:Uncharacterized protein n=1 Tax=Uncultured Desulfatiglans sp. TaxID=1748965 RepID=A0A653A6L0_UNCDX|nr:hypothetical protein TRIP_B250367 [uncultured Desulfatiglans sp.]
MPSCYTRLPMSSLFRLCFWLPEFQPPESPTYVSLMAEGSCVFFSPLPNSVHCEKRIRQEKVSSRR